MVNKLSFVLSMSSKCEVSLLSIFRVLKLMERHGVKSVYYEANASEKFSSLWPPNFNRKQIIKQPSPAQLSNACAPNCQWNHDCYFKLHLIPISKAETVLIATNNSHSNFTMSSTKPWF
jgi:hypothetical protein